MSDRPLGFDNNKDSVEDKINGLQSQFNKLVFQIEKNMKHYIQIDRKFTVISVDIMEIKEDIETMKNVINMLKNEIESTDRFKDELKKDVTNTIEQIQKTGLRVDNIITSLKEYDDAIQIQSVS